MNRLAYVTPTSMKIVSVYKSLPEYSICSFRGSLHRNSSENKKKEIREIIPPHQHQFFLHIFHISLQFFVLFVPHIFVHLFLLRWIFTMAHTFVVSFLCLCSFPLSSLCLGIVHYLSQFLLQRVLVPKASIALPKHWTSHKTSIEV